MRIISVQLETLLHVRVGQKIKVKYFPIVNDEEDKENPIEKDITIEKFVPVDDGSGEIMIIGDDGEHYFESNLL